VYLRTLWRERSEAFAADDGSTDSQPRLLIVRQDDMYLHTARLGIRHAEHRHDSLVVLDSIQNPLLELVDR
jgi:hypothetical protein